MLTSKRAKRTMILKLDMNADKNSSFPVVFDTSAFISSYAEFCIKLVDKVNNENFILWIDLCNNFQIDHIEIDLESINF